MIAITTVGTSLLDYVKERSGDAAAYIDQLDGKAKIGNDNEEKYKKSIDKLTEKIRDLFINDKDGNEKTKASAELSCFEQIKKQYKDENNWDIRLLCTDTLLSHICANIIKDTMETAKDFKENVKNVKIVTIEKLNLDDAKTFAKDGLTNLYKNLRDPLTTPPTLYKNTLLETRIVYNITGGYKALIPFLTIFAQMSNAPIYYLFEDNKQLIKIPQLPVTVDYEKLLPHKQFLLNLRENEMNVYEYDAFVEKNGIILAGCIIEFEGDYVCLNAIGELIVSELEQYPTLEIYNHCLDENMNPDEYRNIKDAVNSLYDSLKNGANGGSYLPDWKDQYINHIPSTIPLGYYIYKHQSPQLRLAYDYDYNSSTLKLYGIRFIKSEKDDKEYDGDFKQTIPEIIKSKKIHTQALLEV